jgi:hypothetical protein
MTIYFSNGYAHGSEKEPGHEIVLMPATITKAAFIEDFVRNYEKVPFKKWIPHCLILQMEKAEHDRVTMWFMNHKGVEILRDYNVKEPQNLEGMAIDLYLQYLNDKLKPVGVGTSPDGDRPKIDGYLHFLYPIHSHQKSNTMGNIKAPNGSFPLEREPPLLNSLRYAKIPSYEEIIVQGKKFFFSERAICSYLLVKGKKSWDRRFLRSISHSLDIALKNGMVEQTEDGYVYSSKTNLFTVNVDCITDYKRI